MPRKTSPSASIETGSLTPAEALQRECEGALQSEALTLAVRDAQQALQRRTHIETAIGRNREQSAAAARRVAELNAALPGLDAQFALASADAAMDPALEEEVARLQSEVDDAVRERADRQVDIERSARAVAVLEREIAVADEAIVTARTQVSVALADLRRDLLSAADEAIAAAVEPLREVKAVLQGVLDAIPGLPMQDDLAAFRLVTLGSAYLERMGAEVRAVGDDLLQVDSVAVEAPDGITSTIQRVLAHRPYSTSKASVFETALSAPYEPRSASKTQLEAWAKERQREAPKPPASQFTGRSWTGGDLRTRAPQPVAQEGNTALVALSKGPE